MGLNTSMSVEFATSRASEFLILMILLDVSLHFFLRLESLLAIDSCHACICVTQDSVTYEFFLSIFNDLLAILLCMDFGVVKFLLVILKFEVTDLAHVNTVPLDIDFMSTLVES